MKYIFIIIILIFNNLSLLSQDSKIVDGKEKNGINYVAIDKDQKLDIIHRFAFEIELLDFLIIDGNNVRMIIETPLAFFYYSFSKIDNVWNENLTTGQLAPNYKALSTSNLSLLAKQPISHSFRIIMDDKISYQTAEKEEIEFDCSIIRKERENWLKRCQEYLLNKKNK